MNPDHGHHDAVERFDREQRLQEIREALREVKDGVDEPIDSGIIETLVGLQAHDINTTQSCEGHDDRALALPWVDISVPEPDGWKDDPKIAEQWTKDNHAMAKRVQTFIDEWQHQRRAEGSEPDDAHILELHERGIYGAVRLEARDQEAMTAVSADERRKRSAVYKVAMRELSEFLQSKFLNQPRTV